MIRRRSGSGSTADRREGVALAIIFVVMVTGHAVWFASDHRLPRWDEIRLDDQTEGLFGPPSTSPFLIPSPYPPLVPVVARLVDWTDSGFAVRRMTTAVAHVVTTILVFWLARRRHAASPSFVAGAWAFNPFAFGWAHAFATEGWVGVFTIGCWLWVAQDKDSRAAQGWVLGLVMSGGLLAKWTFPVFAWVPLLAGWRAGRRSEVLVGLGWAALLAGPWYVLHFPTVARHFEEGVWSGSDALVSARGGVAGGVYYLRELALATWGLPVFGAFLVGLVRLMGGRSSDRWIVLGMLGPLVILSCLPTKQLRHLWPMLPLAGLALDLAVRRRVMRWGAVVLLMLGCIGTSFYLLPHMVLWRRPIPMTPFPRPPGLPIVRDADLAPVVTACARGLDSTRALVAVFSFRSPVTDWNLQHEARRQGVPFRAWSLPWWDSHREAPFPLETVLRSSVWVAQSGATSDRHSGDRRDLGRWAALLSEEVLDVGGALNESLLPLGEWRTAGGPLTSAFAVADVDRTSRALARWVLRWQPWHQGALGILAGKETDSQGGRRAMEDGEVVPPTGFDGWDHRAKAQWLTSEAPLREDLWARLSQVPIRPALQDPREILAEVRVSDRSGPLLLSLANRVAGHRLSVLTCYRRALEAEPGLGPEIARKLGWGDQAPEALLSGLRVAERGTRIGTR